MYVYRKLLKVLDKLFVPINDFPWQKKLKIIDICWFTARKMLLFSYYCNTCSENKLIGEKLNFTKQ